MCICIFLYMYMCNIYIYICIYIYMHVYNMRTTWFHRDIGIVISCLRSQELEKQDRGYVAKAPSGDPDWSWIRWDTYLRKCRTTCIRSTYFW